MAFDPEWLTGVGSILLVGATAVAGWAALRGLDAWRTEMVGRRKAELAEEALAQFYQARDVLIWARFPAEDGEDRSASTPVERLTEESELFSELQASRYRFIAFFGERAAEPFDVVRAIHAEVIASASQLVRDTGERTPEQDERRRRWGDAIGWRPHEDDPTIQRLEDAIRGIEQICRPLIAEDRPHRGLFGLSRGKA